jgi:hypothetical protein
MMYLIPHFFPPFVLLKSFYFPQISSWAQFLPGAEGIVEDSDDISLLPKIKFVQDDGMMADLEDLEVKPLDKWNIELLDKVHPPKWQNPKPTGVYNMVVIGAGAGGTKNKKPKKTKKSLRNNFWEKGLVTAAACAGLGGKVAIIEKNLMGGDCLNVGCVPSKALIRAAHAVAAVKVQNTCFFCIPSFH